MQKNALLLCSLAIIVLVSQADASAPANFVCKAICPSGWVSSDANATPTCPSDCPNSCKILEDVCCPGRKYGVCSSTESTTAGGATTVASGSATPTAPASTGGASMASMTSGSVTATAALSSTVALSAASSVASVVSSAASSASPATSISSAGSLIQPSFMVAFATVMFCILKFM